MVAATQRQQAGGILVRRKYIPSAFEQRKCAHLVLDVHFLRTEGQRDVARSSPKCLDRQLEGAGAGSRRFRHLPAAGAAPVYLSIWGTFDSSADVLRDRY